ncbi:MAG: FCD domain-containing protein [Halofilum sp. (in: g-proteobacteria)]|nr:FCD domain-containing protein [Halofilum sp. (in: g-proteobacteria)]
MVASLRAAIAQKHYGHGDRLPAERELAERFGTSRGTARHAEELERLGMVTRRIGSGAFVNSPGLGVRAISPKRRVRSIDRGALRHRAAHGAAGGHECLPRDLARVRESLELVEAAGDPATFTETDEAFHLTLADCSQNPLIVWLYQQINDVRSHSQWSEVKEKILDAEKIAEYNAHHRLIYLGIAGRDTAAAVEAMNRHLAVARDDLVGTRNENNHSAATY